MKVLNAEQIRAADQYTIANEPVSAIDLMERASLAFCMAFQDLFSVEKQVCVFCGPGNNGGDGLAISRILHDASYSINTFILKTGSSFSADFITNHEALLKKIPENVFYITSPAQLPGIKADAIVIDAIFGTGMSRPIEGLAGEIIKKINISTATVVAVDLPSGLYTDKANAPTDIIVKANYTFTFQVPKLSFLLCKNLAYTGILKVLDIKLSKSFIEAQNTSYYYTDRLAAKALIKPRQRNSHKGSYGHTLIWAGAYGKAGAALLCAKACLRTGAGLVTAYVPECAYIPFQTALAESMVITDDNSKYLSTHPDISPYKTMAIGPGIGNAQETIAALKNLLTEINNPVVLDADALNIIASNPKLLDQIPEGSILTPHPKEFERLAGPCSNDTDRMEKATAFAKKYNCVLVLKSAVTSVHIPNGEVHFNSTGNPGMAKGGSGDVLTGTLAALLSQGYESGDAAILGVYLHGLAGDIAATQSSQWSLLAHEIADNIGNAFRSTLA